MKISYSWLNDYLPVDLSPEEAGAALTGCGLEVESIDFFESVPGGLRGLVIGEVKEKTKHPNADKLSLTRVDVGGPELLSIVCGAPNVEAGQKVVVALVGTTVHPATGEPFEIKKSKIRGELSEGMLCAEDEIGLGASHAGIMVLDADAKVGTPAAAYFGVKADAVLEIGLTPNRADAASHFGVARDLAAVLHARELMQDHDAQLREARLPSTDAFAEDLPPCTFDVTVENPEACPRYCGVVIGGLEVKPSPGWLQNRLKAIGLRPINNVVDVTNYVLHELGQPLHAFDADRIAGGKVVVKKLAAGTKFTTLDGVERTLHADDLMICDAEKPMCIAGVFGGLDSGVTETTKTIFLESATFDSVHVRKTSKRFGLKTDASFRFERGTDPNMPLFALQRAAYLLREIAGGEAQSAPVDIYPEPVEDFQIAFSFRNCEALIGKAIERGIVKKIMQSLGIQFISEGSDGLLLAVPPFKVDVQREADVVEEILRIYGYNHIEIPERMTASIAVPPKPDPEAVQHAVADMLSAAGFSEIWTNSLVRGSDYDNLPMFPADETVRLLNPLSSDLDVMRRTMLFGGLQTIAYNQNRRQADLRLYEFGKVYKTLPQSEGWKYQEDAHLAVFMTGRRQPESWNHGAAAVDFFDLKAAVQQVLGRLGLTTVKEETFSDELLAEGLRVSEGRRELVRYGRVQPAVLKKHGVEAPVWYADFTWANLLGGLARRGEAQHKEVAKFPSVRRDLALVLGREVSFREVEQLAYQAEKQLLRSVNIFDVYEGDNIGQGKKSYAVSFILQDENATLTDKQIDKVMEKLVKTYTEKLGASIRS